MIGTLKTRYIQHGHWHVTTRSTFMTLCLVVGLVVGTLTLWAALERFQEDGTLGAHAAVGAAFMALGLFALIRFKTVKLKIRKYTDEFDGLDRSDQNVARWAQKRLLTQQTRVIEFPPDKITGVHVVSSQTKPEAVYLTREGYEDLLLVHLRQGSMSSVKKTAMFLRVPLTKGAPGTEPEVLWYPGMI